jgi:carboxylesterase
LTGDTLDPNRFEFEGGPTGILLLHGYTAATPEMRPLGEYLAGKGMSVVAPLLPGHGTTVADLNTRSWREVAEAAADELYSLQGKCERVFVGGLSMGGLLTLHLGQRCPDIAGLIPMAAALDLQGRLHLLLPLLKHFRSTLDKSSDVHVSIEDAASASLIWSYKQNPLRFADEVIGLMHHVRDRLHQIHQPILAFQAGRDRTVSSKAGRRLMSETSSTDTTLVTLENSGHCLSIDGERDQLCARTWQWIQDHARS